MSCDSVVITGSLLYLKNMAMASGATLASWLAVKLGSQLSTTVRFSRMRPRISEDWLKFAAMWTRPSTRAGSRGTSNCREVASSPCRKIWKFHLVFSPLLDRLRYQLIFTGRMRNEKLFLLLSLSTVEL